MDNIKATPRNSILGSLADILSTGKSFANQYEILPQIPLIGGTGLGDLFMGKAPELIDDISYDGLQAALRGGNSATGGIGTYGAKPAVADAALLGLDLAGIGKGLGGLTKKTASVAYDSLMNGATSLSRRDAIKKIGAAAGSVAVSGSGVGLLRKFANKTAEDVTPKLADNIAATTASPKNYRFNTLSEYLDNVYARANDEAFTQHAELGGAWDEEVPEEYVEKWLNYFLRKDEINYTNAKDIASGHLKLDSGSMPPPPMEVTYNHKTKQFENLEYLDAFSPQAKQEMKDWKNGVNKLNSDFGFDPINQKDWVDWVHNSDNHKETLDYLRHYLNQSK